MAYGDPSIADAAGSGDPTPYPRLPDPSIASVIDPAKPPVEDDPVIPPAATGFAPKKLPPEVVAGREVPQVTAQPPGAIGFPTPEQSAALGAPAEQWKKDRDAWQAQFGRFFQEAHKSEEAYRKQTVYQPGELREWDTEAQMKRFATDPLGAFGSIGSIFGLMAAGFTRHPMTNSLNALAGAINGVREGDEAAYNKAYKAWQDNTKLALDRHNLIQKDYDNVVAANERDQGRLKFGLEMSAQKYKDDTALAYLHTYGYGPEFVEFLNKRNDAALKMQALAENTTQNMFRQKIFENQVTHNNETIADPHQLAAANLQAQATIMGMQLDPKNERQQLIAQMWVKHGPNTEDPWPIEKILDAANKEYNMKYYGRSSSSTQDQTRRILERTDELIKEGKPPAEAHRQAADEVLRADAAAKATSKPLSMSQGDYIRVQRRKLELMEEGKSENDAESQARSELERDKAAGRAEGRPSGKSAQEAHIAELLASGNPDDLKKANSLIEARRTLSQKLSTKEELTDLALQQMAAQYIAGDESVKKGLTRGSEIIRLDNAIAAMQKEQGITPEMQKAAIADYKGLIRGYNVIYNRSAAISVSAAEAKVGLEIAREYNALVDRGKFIPINKLLLATREKISDEAVWGLKQALHTLINQYSNTISRTGSGTVSDKNRAEEALSTFNGVPVASKEALEAVFTVMEKEIEAAKRAPAEARRMMREGMSAEQAEKKLFKNTKDYD